MFEDLRVRMKKKVLPIADRSCNPENPHTKESWQWKPIFRYKGLVEKTALRRRTGGQVQDCPPPLPLVPPTPTDPPCPLLSPTDSSKLTAEWSPANLCPALMGSFISFHLRSFPKMLDHPGQAPCKANNPPKFRGC